MAATIENAKKRASKLFLGKGVVGVGVAHKDHDLLVFLLDRDSPETERAISDWARRNKVGIRFRVTGVMSPLAGEG